MWKGFIGKLSGKAPKSGGGGGGGWGSPPSKSPTSYGANGGQWDPMRSSPPLPVVAGAEGDTREDVFLRKVTVCCVLFDFSTDRGRDSPERERKRQVLMSLVDCVGAAEEPLTEAMISACVGMFAINLFRVFPPKVRPGAGGAAEADEDDPFFDPSWYHLQVVYELLLRFVMSPVVDVKVARKFVSEDDHHNGIAELLEVFGSVISGFAKPLKEEHKLFLCKALIPLHKPKAVGMYLPQLTYCITQFIDKEPKLSGTVIRGLLKYWPVTNSQKEMMFLGELEEVLELTEMPEFQKCMVPLFRRVAHCLHSSHFQVAERALYLWNNEHLFNLISRNHQVILPIIYPALERNARLHWNQSVLNVTMNVRKMFFDMDQKLLLACQKKFQEEEEKQAESEERRRLIWEHLERNAAFHPVTGDISFSVVTKSAPLVAPTMT
ncbi:hypothetical protein ACQ4PT_054843 [Festuca glaucescens]